eukprot:7135611-Lingulodinium_polyedra.AAC.1
MGAALQEARRDSDDDIDLFYLEGHAIFTFKPAPGSFPVALITHRDFARYLQKPPRGHRCAA